MSIAWSFGRACRGARIGLDVTQDELAAAVGVTRGYIARIEGGRVNVSVAVMEKIGEALGLGLQLVASQPVFLGQSRPHDVVHAHCAGFISRRLRAAGWQVEAELDVSAGRVHGWVDLVAFHRSSRRLLVIEIKTRLDDLGAMQRQIGWYERHAPDGVGRFGWTPRFSTTWLVCLSSAEVDDRLVAHRAVMDRDFPNRAPAMLAIVRGEEQASGRGLAMIDPTSRRRDWLQATRIDGRRTRPAYADYADAARRIPRRRP